MSANLTSKQADLAKALTRLQYKFVINLFSGMTQRQAYIKAGGASKTADTQDACASRMLSDARVRAFYDSLMEEAKSDAVMTKQEALIHLTRSAKVKLTDVCEFKNIKAGVDDDGEPFYKTVLTAKDSKDIPDYIAASIKSISVSRDGARVDLYDSNAAVKQLGCMLGWELPVKATAPPVKFDFDDNASPSDQAAQIVREAAAGRIPPDVAQMFISSIASIIKIDEITELASRLTEIEKMMDLSSG